MRVEDNQESTQPAAPFCALPSVEGERRKEQDRRSMERQGKYDRRRNKCIHCSHFDGKPTVDNGFCKFHQVAMAGQAFACPNFEPANPTDARKP